MDVLPAPHSPHVPECSVSSGFAESNFQPKCGVLPISPFLARSDDVEAAIKHRVCRFRMHQEVKYRDGEVARVSAYCPLDLFSGREERVRRAWHALADCPQNNLRLFHRTPSGLVAVPVDLSSADRWTPAVCQWATNGSASVAASSLEICGGHTLLSRLALLQQLDSWDIEIIHHLPQLMQSAQYLASDPPVMSFPQLVCSEPLV